jgi:hypothetical protein
MDLYKVKVLFYRYVSIHPNVYMYFTDYARDARRKAVIYLFIYLFMSDINNSGMCRQILVTILSAFLELLYSCEGRGYQTPAAGLIKRLNTNQTSDLYSRM